MSVFCWKWAILPSWNFIRVTNCASTFAPGGFVNAAVTAEHHHRFAAVHEFEVRPKIRPIRHPAGRTVRSALHQVPCRGSCRHKRILPPRSRHVLGVQQSDGGRNVTASHGGVKRFGDFERLIPCCSLAQGDYGTHRTSRLRRISLNTLGIRRRARKVSKSPTDALKDWDEMLYSISSDRGQNACAASLHPPGRGAALLCGLGV